MEQQISAHCTTEMSPANLQDLETQGYVLLRAAIPVDWLDPLRQAFDAGILGSDQWPVPRGRDWVHSLMETNNMVQQLCRIPAMLDCVGHILQQPFFLSQVEGREPVKGNAPQLLHRDSAGLEGNFMAAMAWLDPFDMKNGATQIIPGSHKKQDMAHTDAIVMEGEAGDLLIFDPDVLHGATTNVSGARRRALLISYASTSVQHILEGSKHLRNVTMDSSEVFNHH